VSVGSEIYRAALMAGVLLEESEGDLRLRSLTGPVASDLRELLRASKNDVIAFLHWRDAALAEVAECLERLGRSYAGAPLDAPEVDDAEARITANFWTQDERAFTAAVRDWRLAVWRADVQHRQDGP